MPHMLISNLILANMPEICGEFHDQASSVFEIDQYAGDMPEIIESGEEKTFRDVVWMFSV